MSDDLYILSEQQLRNSSHDHLVQFCLGLMNTANIQHRALERTTALIEQATLELGVWPPAPQS